MLRLGRLSARETTSASGPSLVIGVTRKSGGVVDTGLSTAETLELFEYLGEWLTVNALWGFRSSRDWWALGLPNPSHPRDPRLWLWRVRHYLTGPRRGCSCSTRCFDHPKRRVPAAEVYRDRVRLGKLEARVLKLEKAQL